ncbi:Transcription Factor Hes-3 [Manis pentadactyla]|nr:Transcription Factor Hes-3 [Manis pentadactyla]
MEGAQAEGSGEFPDASPSCSLPSGFHESWSILLTCKREAPIKAMTSSPGRRYYNMGTEPRTQGSLAGSAGSFRKISKPLMEKKRRARINVSLEQLKSLLEKHYSHQIQKRKLEKADILELSVKYMKSLQNSVQGLWPVPSGAEYPSGFRRCLPGVSQFLRRGEEGGGGPRCPLVPERVGGSTMDSADPCPETPGTRGFCAPAVWAPVPVSGGSRSPPPRLLFPEGLPGPTSSVPAPQPASRRCADSPGAGLRVWRPW